MESTTQFLNRDLKHALSSAIFAVAAIAAPAAAQVNYYFQPVAAAPEADRQWHINENWLDPNLGNMFVPNVLFNERGIIDNGATAILTVDSPNDPQSEFSVVTPGVLAIQDGGLDIRSTGALFVTAGNGASGNLTVGSPGTGLVIVNPGGTLSVDGTLSVASDTGSTLTVGGSSGATATVTANAAFLGGTTHVFANADFSSIGGVNFPGSAVYQVEIAGASSNGSISAGGAVSLGGSLDLNFTGPAPSAGDSWDILEGSSISGAFASVSSNASLAFNETIVLSQVASGGGRALRASLEEVLVLEVNRNTGMATITHPGASSITLDGYFVGSDSGSLSDNPADWTSLTEGGQLGNDWVETAQTTSNIGELKIGADATFTSDIPLGQIYNALAGEFGETGEDLVFGYRRSSDGVEFPGIVQYTGDLVNSLILQVDPSGSGDALLRNTSGTTVAIDAYEVLSDSGSLSVSGWNSLDEQGMTPNEWLEALDVSENLLAEFDSQGFTTIEAGASINLGPLFAGGAQDLEFNFLMEGQELSTPGVVIYQVGIPGDFNNDGVVNAIDYAVWRDNIGADGLPNDNGLGTVGQAHYDLWQSQYGATGAEGGVAVPEPAAAMLLGAVLGVVTLARRR